MDSMSTYELVATIMAHREIMDSQLHFWLSITFAVIVAKHAMGTRMIARLKAFIGTLYLLATLAMVARLYQEGLELEALFMATAQRDVPHEAPMLAFSLRSIMVAAGTIGTLFFLAVDRSRDNDSPGTNQEIRSGTE
jgi:hypothetical protein